MESQESGSVGPTVRATAGDHAYYLLRRVLSLLVLAGIAYFVLRWIAAGWVVEVLAALPLAALALHQLILLGMGVGEIITGVDESAGNSHAAAGAADGAESRLETVRDRAGFFLWSLIRGAAIVVVLHAIAWTGFESGNWFLQLLGLVPVSGYVLWRLLPGHDLLLLFVRLAFSTGRRSVREGRELVRESGEYIAFRLIVLFAVLTEAFAAWTAFWAERDALNASFPDGQSAFAAAERLYVWHFFDAVPILEIPATLNWTLNSRYDDWTSGAFVLAYKLIAILPILGGLIFLVRTLWHAQVEAQEQAEAHEDTSPPDLNADANH